MRIIRSFHMQRKLSGYSSVRLILCGVMLFCLLFGGGSTAMASPRLQPLDEKIVIVIDPGHGGKNEGTIENGFLEKSMTMVTARAMYEELCKYDNVEVYLTRTQDVGMSLKKRAEFAASVNADFLFSIHYNASLNHELYGSEVWISSQQPYHAYGYQFGCVQMHTMEDMGLFLRGVKTRLNDEGTDYYGIIRESVALSVPAAIIEHCHVDEDRDVPFCDSEEKLIAFGKADALSVAKYFGLKSTELNVDYSAESAALAEASQNEKVQLTQTDMTVPDICSISLKGAEDETGQVTIEVSAADYDSMLLYYDYSIDGGTTYSPRQAWPNCNVFDGTYTDTFSTVVTVPSGEQPKIIFRAYNLFDRYTESNTITFTRTVLYGADKEAMVPAGGAGVADGSSQTGQTDREGHPVQTGEGEITQTGQPAGEGENAQTGQPPQSEEGIKAQTGGGGTAQANAFDDKKLPLDRITGEENSEEASFLSFLEICLGIVILLFVIVLLSRIVTDCRRRRRRRQRRKEAGDSSRQIR